MAGLSIVIAIDVLILDGSKKCIDVGERWRTVVARRFSAGGLRTRFGVVKKVGDIENQQFL